MKRLFSLLREATLAEVALMALLFGFLYFLYVI